MVQDALRLRDLIEIRKQSDQLLNSRHLCLCLCTDITGEIQCRSFYTIWFIINDLGSLTIHVNKKTISLSLKQCKTMIQYGSYLHKSRVIVFIVSDSSLCTNQWFITVPFLLSVFSEIKRLACCGTWPKRDHKSHNLILLFNKKNAYVLFRALRKSVSFWKTCF